ISQCLHGGIIHDPYGAFECGFKVETDPSVSQIPRFRNGPVPENRSRVTDGYDVILPVPDKLPNLGNHSFWSQCWSRVELAMCVFTRGEDLDMSSAYINNQHVHKIGRASCRERVSIWRAAGCI